jgi:hypothetical protein
MGSGCEARFYRSRIPFARGDRHIRVAPTGSAIDP